MSRQYLIRSNVHIIPNEMGSTYEVIEGEGVITRVNIRQIEAWFEGGKLYQSIKEVPYDTDIAIYRTNHVLPGNILTAYTTEQIDDEDSGFCMMWDEFGDIVQTAEGYPIYKYEYYSPTSKYQPTGELADNDDIEKLTGNYL